VHFSAATYNVHQWIGSDGRCDPFRAMELIRLMAADVTALQEVVLSADEPSGLSGDRIARHTGCRLLHGPTFLRHDGHFGNVLLTPHRVVSFERVDLTVEGREPRGALDARLEIRGRPVRVVATHLGLRAGERRVQVSRLLEQISRKPQEPVLLMGDFNEWLPLSPSLRRLKRFFGKEKSPATFPSRFPLFALDRVWGRPTRMVARARAFKSPLSRLASDHLPLLAEISWPRSRALAKAANRIPG